MNIRERTEAFEAANLSPFASLSQNSRGRDLEEIPCDIRTDYQRDRDRIVHAKAFRRLKHKTQVFLSPEGDHYRTRLTHTLEVSQIARTIAKALRLNEDLTEAIALGHDLGHTPFGHTGERVLDDALKEVGERFIHSAQSVRVVEKLEKNGQGLNLTWEVRDGILNHGTASRPNTLEGQIVRISDKIAYINHDIDDAIRAHVLEERDLPADPTRVLGHTVGERLNTIIHDLITQSTGVGEILQSPEVAAAMGQLRSFMFAHVYTSPLVKKEETKAKWMIRQLYLHYLENWDTLPNEYIEMRMRDNEREEIVVSDYISGMTDGYAIKKFEEIFMPQGWK